MRARSIFLLLSLSACGQVANQNDVQRIDTGFWRAQPELTEVDILRKDGSRLVLINKETNTPRYIERPLEDLREFSVKTKLADEDLLELAQFEAKTLFPSGKFKLKHIRNGKAFSYVTLTQDHEGRSVVGAELTLQMTSQGEWTTIKSSVFPPTALPAKDFEKSQASLPTSLHSQVQVISETEVIYPRKENEVFKYYFAREYSISDPVNNTGFVIWVDEKSGEILGQFNPEHGVGNKEIVGTILPNAVGDEEVEVKLPSMKIRVGSLTEFFDDLGRFDFSDLLGQKATITLSNPYLAVVNNGGQDNGGIVDITEDFLARDGKLDFNPTSTLEERNIYYWVMQARKFLEEELEFYEMDYQILAMARDGMKVDNAYFNPLFKLIGRPVLGFGEGDTFFKNTALSRDIVLHEYGHALTHEIYGLKNTYEFSAMNEAFSDYFAATITNDPLIAENMMVDPKMGYLRRVDNDMVYPKDFGGKRFHTDGQMFSGALWELRRQIGQKIADQLIHEARLSQATSIIEFYSALLKIDEALYGDGNEWTPSQHKVNIRRAFRKHGLTSRTQFVQPEQEDLTIPWTSCWHN